VTGESARGKNLQCTLRWCSKYRIKLCAWNLLVKMLCFTSLICKFLAICQVLEQPCETHCLLRAL
jgi:hypothetical protein